MPQMRRAQALFHLLLLWLLLTEFQHHSITTTKVQATRSVDFKLGPAQPNSSLTTRDILTTRKNNIKQFDEKKIHKRPSGPNPVGNHRPPTRP